MQRQKSSDKKNSDNVINASDEAQVRIGDTYIFVTINSPDQALNCVINYLQKSYGDKADEKVKEVIENLQEYKESLKHESDTGNKSNVAVGKVAEPEQESDVIKEGDNDKLKSIQEVLVEADKIINEIPNVPSSRELIFEEYQRKLDQDLDGKKSNQKNDGFKISAYDKLKYVNNLIFKNAAEASGEVAKWLVTLNNLIDKSLKICAAISDTKSDNFQKIIELNVALDYIREKYEKAFDDNNDDDNKNAKKKGKEDKDSLLKKLGKELGDLYKEFYWNKQKPCEFFFEYRIVSSPHNIDENYPEPYLFVECDKNGEYKMCVVLPEWCCGDGEELNDYNRSNEHFFKELGKRKNFSQVELEFMPCREMKFPDEKSWGIDQFFGEANQIEIKNPGKNIIKINQDYEEYCQGLRRIEIDPDKKSGFNGYGKIRLTHPDKDKIAEYVFFVNFNFRKRIIYRLYNTENNKIAVNINKDSFSKNKKISVLAREYGTNKALISPQEIGDGLNVLSDDSFLDANKLYLTFADRNDEKKYLLERIANNFTDSVGGGKPIKKATSAKDLVCPYCHTPIEWDSPLQTERYYNGAISCKGKMTGTLNIKEQKANKCIYCDGFLKKDGSLFDESKLLPFDFLNSDSFRLAVVGSRRSGKTFWLARLFPLGNYGKIALDQSPIHKYLEKCRFIESELRYSYSVSEKNFREGDWDAGFKESFQWDVKSGRCPTPTTTSTVGSDGKTSKLEYLESNPLAFKSRKKNSFFVKERSQHVFVYDMPGERFYKTDLNTGKPDTNLESLPLVDCPNRLGAVFIFNNRKATFDGATKEELYDTFEKFLTRLKDSEAGNISLAVVLTKFDKYEEDFDSNSHCLRGDVLEMADFVSVNGRKKLRYSGSALQNNIDLASMEIENYLRRQISNTNKNIFDILKEHKGKIKFFGVSALGNEKSLFHAQDVNEKNVLQFYASPKRIELPFIWMMHEFGLID